MAISVAKIQLKDTIGLDPEKGEQIIKQRANPTWSLILKGLSVPLAMFSAKPFGIDYKILQIAKNAISAILLYFPHHVVSPICEIPKQIQSNPYFNQSLINKVNTIAKKMQIEKEVAIYENFDQGFQAVGQQAFGKIGISLPSSLLFPEIDLKYRLAAKPVTPKEMREGIGCENEKSLNFLIGHELAHIKNNDLVKLTIIPNLVELATLVLLNNTKMGTALGEIWGPIAAMWMGLTSFFLTSRYCENQADLLSAKTLGTPGIEGGVAFFSRQRELNQSTKGRTVSKDGENLLDFTHPSLKSRTERLTALKEKLD